MHARARTHMEGGAGGKRGWGVGGWQPRSWLPAAGPASITVVLHVSWEFNNFSPLIKIKSKQMRWAAYATEK